MIRSRPAPASRANSASSAAKKGLETPFDTYQNTSPEHLARTPRQNTSPEHLARTPRRRSAARRRSRTATYSGGGQARWAADLWAPTPGAGSASARCGARRSPRLRLAWPGAGLSPQRRPAPAFLNASRSSGVAEEREAGAGLVHRPADRLQGLPAAL